MRQHLLASVTYWQLLLIIHSQSGETVTIVDRIGLPLVLSNSIAIAVFTAMIGILPRHSEKLKHGVCTITRPDVRWENCYIKSLNLLPNVLAKQEAKALFLE